LVGFITCLFISQPALELPARQRMQLGVLVDRPVDADEQALSLQRFEMTLEIEGRPGLTREVVVLMVPPRGSGAAPEGIADDFSASRRATE